MKIFAFIFVFIFSFGNAAFTQSTLNFTTEEKAWIKAHPVIHFGYEPNWEPYEIYKNGKYGGIVGDYVKILAQKTGIKFIPIPNMKWHKSIDKLDKGSIMMIPSFVNTAKREQEFELTDPYIIDPIVVVGNRTSSYFSMLSDLTGKTIALPKDYYTNELIKKKYPNIKIKNYLSVEACLEALITNKVDAFVGNLNVVSYYRNNYGFDDLKIVGIAPFKNNGICLAMNKQWKVFRNIADKVFKNITPQQAHDIRSRWIGINKDAYYSSSFFKWTIFSFVLIFLIMLIFFYRNNALKKGISKGRIIEQNLQNQLTSSEKEIKLKQVMFQEMHHRIKNNLQIVSSVLNLQANAIPQEKSRMILRNSAERVNSVALIHHTIYASNRYKELDLKIYIQSLYDSLYLAYKNEKKVSFSVQTKECIIKVESIIPLALIINELLTNSFNYAFDNEENPTIEIKIMTITPNKGVTIEYKDNGTWKKPNDSDRFGTSLIEIFTEQLNGHFQLNKLPTNTIYQFTFPNILVLKSSIA